MLLRDPDRGRPRRTQPSRLVKRLERAIVPFYQRLQHIPRHTRRRERQLDLIRVPAHTLRFARPARHELTELGALLGLVIRGTPPYTQRAKPGKERDDVLIHALVQRHVHPPELEARQRRDVVEARADGGPIEDAAADEDERLECVRVRAQETVQRALEPPVEATPGIGRGCDGAGGVAAQRARVAELEVLEYGRGDAQEEPGAAEEPRPRASHAVVDLEPLQVRQGDAQWLARGARLQGGLGEHDAELQALDRGAALEALGYLEHI
ncbi:hypothetical protein EVG20_g6591 [Dentipellis fragilis]|uniref:Uncharacterized protein n=1 Tax=Dentipellis fragilis TaxID=205917 RepID=A0A4Y9YM95_9AGAM|nr:hypothetical protein EVG20_g6591 [Dentipellis fragilis]